MKKFILLLLIPVQQIFAQGFQQLYGGPDHERAQNVFPFSGGYMIGGVSKSFGAGYYDACLIKIDLTGQVQWGKSYGNSGFDNSECAIPTFDDNIVSAGRTELIPGGATTATIFKTDSTGDLLWSRSFGLNSNSSFANIIETFDHGYAAIGYIDNSGSRDIMFVRTDINGDTLFTRVYGSSFAEGGINLIQASDSSFYLCGRIINGGLSAALLIHTDSMGNILWANSYGGTAWDEFNSLKQTVDTSLIITGGTTSAGHGDYDMLLVKTDLQGGVRWSNTYGGLRTDASYDIRIVNNGYVISGYTETFGNRGDDSTNILLMKTDTGGTVIWMQVYGDGLQDEGFRCELDNDGGFLFPAFTLSYLLNDSTQMLIIKTDSNGVSGCHEQPETPGVIAYPLTPVTSNLSSQPLGSLDTLLFIQNTVAVSNDDACAIAATNEAGSKQNLKIYPNPANQSFTLETSGNGLMNIRNSSGQLISTHSFHEKILLSTDDLPDGFYLVEVISDDTTVRKSICVIH